MNPNQIPTESGIEAQAKFLFPLNLEAQASFIMGVWNTLYTLIIKTR